MRYQAVLRPGADRAARAGLKLIINAEVVPRTAHNRGVGTGPARREGEGLQAWHGTAVDRRAGQAARLPEAYRTAAEEVLEPGVALLSE